jgi:hypothetical protein
MLQAEARGIEEEEDIKWKHCRKKIKTEQSKNK